MNRIHGWKTLTAASAAAVMAIVLSGCQTAGYGTPHPFTTLFHTNEPACRLYESAQYEADSIHRLQPVSTNDSSRSFGHVH